MKLLILPLLCIGLFFANAYSSTAVNITAGKVEAIGIRNSGDPAWENKFLLSIAGKKYFIRTDLENGREMLTVILTAYERSLTVYGMAEPNIIDGQGRQWLVFLHTGTL